MWKWEKFDVAIGGIGGGISDNDGGTVANMKKLFLCVCISILVLDGREKNALQKQQCEFWRYMKYLLWRKSHLSVHSIRISATSSFPFNKHVCFAYLFIFSITQTQLRLRGYCFIIYNTSTCRMFNNILERHSTHIWQIRIINNIIVITISVWRVDFNCAI